MSCQVRVCPNCSTELRGDCPSTTCCQWNSGVHCPRSGGCYRLILTCNYCLETTVGQRKTALWLENSETAFAQLNAIVSTIQSLTNAPYGAVELIELPEHTASKQEQRQQLQTLVTKLREATEPGRVVYILVPAIPTFVCFDMLQAALHSKATVFFVSYQLSFTLLDVPTTASGLCLSKLLKRQAELGRLLLDCSEIREVAQERNLEVTEEALASLTVCAIGDTRFYTYSLSALNTHEVTRLVTCLQAMQVEPTVDTLHSLCTAVFQVRVSKEQVHKLRHSLTSSTHSEETVPQVSDLQVPMHPSPFVQAAFASKALPELPLNTLVRHFQAAAREVKQCPLCLEETQEGFDTGCPHKFHEQCFTIYVRDLVSRGKDVICPVCRLGLDVDLAGIMNLGEGELKCLNPWCSHTFFVTSTEFTCPECRQSYCLRCNSQLTPECACVKSRQQQQEELKDMFEAEEIKRCPYCDALICNEEEDDTWVQCICGVEFCFVCEGVDCSCQF